MTTPKAIHADEQSLSLEKNPIVANPRNSSNCKIVILNLPFGDRILFLVRRPLTIRGRRMGLGAFRRPRYLARTPSKTTPADSDANTIYLN